MAFRVISVEIVPEDWKPEAFDTKILRQENASLARNVVKDALADSIEPFIIDFRTPDNSLTSQIVVSGTFVSPAPIQPENNWINVGYLNPGCPEKQFGPYQDRKICPSRVGNDQRGIGTRGRHGQFHVQTPYCSPYVLPKLPTEKRNLSDTVEYLAIKLQEQITKDYQSNP